MLPFDEAALLKAVGTGEDRSDDRAGEGVHRAAGHYRRTLRAGAGAGREQWRRRSTTSTRRLRSKMRFPSTVEGQLLGIADRIQTIVAMFGIGNGADGIEGSVCAAARGECDREDSGRVGVAADAGRCDGRVAAPRTPSKAQVPRSSASGCSSI